jgi:hypothetical protein
VTHFSAVRAILAGGLIVALLDGLYPVILYGLRGVPPGRVFQGIAAGLLGREAFRGGMATAALGLGLHVFIALVVVATYFAMSVRLRALRTRPLLLGPVYGVAVYVFMNLVVIPLSAAGGARPAWPMVLGGLAIHMVGVGLPAAWVAAAYHSSQRSQPPAAPSLPPVPADADTQSRARVH